MRSGLPPRRLRRLRASNVLGIEVPVADRLGARLLGLALICEDRAGPGLLIPRCSTVHTFGMRFALDLVFLDSRGAALRIEPAVPPCRVRACRGARSVLELPSGGLEALSSRAASRPAAELPR